MCETAFYRWNPVLRHIYPIWFETEVDGKPRTHLQLHDVNWFHPRFCEWWPALTRLIVFDLHLHYPLPPLGQFANLCYLRIDHGLDGRLALPGVLRGLSSLRELELVDVMVDVDNDLDCLTLIKLTLVRCGLTALPTGVLNTTTLRELSFGGNAITSFAGIERLEFLEVLNPGSLECWKIEKRPADAQAWAWELAWGGEGEPVELGLLPRLKYLVLESKDLCRYRDMLTSPGSSIYRKWLLLNLTSHTELIRAYYSTRRAARELARTLADIPVAWIREQPVYLPSELIAHIVYYVCDFELLCASAIRWGRIFPG